MNGFESRLTTLFQMFEGRTNQAFQKNPVYTPEGTMGLNDDIEIHADSVDVDSNDKDPLDLFVKDYFCPTGTYHDRIVVFFTVGNGYEIIEIGAVEIIHDELKSFYHTFAMPNAPLSDCCVSESFLENRGFPPTLMAVFNFLNWVRDAPLISFGTHEHLQRLAYSVNQLRWIGHLSDESFAKDISVIMSGRFFTLDEVKSFKPPVRHPVYDIQYDARRRYKQRCLDSLSKRLKLNLPPIGGSTIEVALNIALCYQKMKGCNLIKERVELVSVIILN
jgi:hypothetical protein